MLKTANIIIWGKSFEEANSCSLKLLIKNDSLITNLGMSSTESFAGKELSGRGRFEVQIKRS